MASVDTSSKGVRNRGKRRRNKNETMLGDGRRRKVVAVTVVGSSGENGMEWGYGSSRSRSVATVIWMRFSSSRVESIRLYQEQSRSICEINQF